MLEVKDLSVIFELSSGPVKAVEKVSFEVEKGKTLGLLGESGSGKSTVALSLLKLVSHPGRISSGKVLLDGQDLLKLEDKELRKVRGRRISMIFQDPFTSLNPVFTVGEQIAEAVRLHQGLGNHKAWEKAVEMLDLCKIKDPKGRAHNYPHQFSGGMRQRVMAAMALSCQPDFLIADEPTTALDVTIQAQILDLIQSLQKQLGFGMIFITHNFALVKQLCEEVVILKKGEVVEAGKTQKVFNAPQQAYTKNLVDSLIAMRSL